MHLDVRTMYIVTAMTCFLIPAALLIFEAGRFRPEGVLQLILGYAFHGIFMTLLGLRGLIPDFLSIVVATGFLPASYSLLYAAVREFQHRPYSRRILFIPALGTLLFFWVFWAYVDSMFLRIIFISLLSSVQLGAIAWTLFRDAPVQMRRSQWLTGGLLAVGAMIWLFRFFEGLFFPPHQAQVLGSSWVQTVGVMIALGILILAGIGYLLMARERAGEELRESEERFRKLADSTFEGVIIHDKGEILDVNQAMMKMMGYDYDEIIGRNVLNAIEPASREWVLHHMQADYEKPFEVLLKKKDGVPLLAEVYGMPILFKGRTARVVALRDITERKKMEEEILSLAITDPLTGLFNRRGFVTLAGQQMKIADRTKKGFLLVFTDLDDLKLINDALGHNKGDEALADVAKILKEIFREEDIVARVGGDEFAVLAMETTLDSSDTLRDRLQVQVDICNASKEKEYRLALSTGMAYYDPEKPASLEDLMAHADKEMYLQKRKKSA